MYCFIDFEFVNPPIEKENQKACLSVGAVWVNEQFEVVDDFYQVIQPPFEVEATRRLEKTRGWSEALPFIEVYQKFRDWLPNSSRIIYYTFGRFDQAVFKEDCDRHGVQDFLTPQWKDYQQHLIENWQLKRGEPWRDSQPSLEWMKRLLGNQHPFVSHDALEDAYDLMLVAKSFELNQPMEENPLHLERHERRLNQSSLAPFQSIRSLTHSVDIQSKYGKTSLDPKHRVKKKAKSPIRHRHYWQAVILRRNENFYTFDYYNEKKIRILKGDCRFIDHEWKYTFTEHTQAGRLLIQHGILPLHLRIRQEYPKTFVTNHRLPGIASVYFRVTHKGAISTNPQPVRFHQGWGFVQVIWKEQEDTWLPLGYRLSLMSLNLEYQLFQSVCWRSKNESPHLFLFKLYQLIEQHPYIKFYTLERERLAHWFENFGFSTNRLRDLGAILRKRFAALNWSYSTDQEALTTLAAELNLIYRNKDESFRELEQMIQIYRWDRNIILHAKTPNLLQRQQLRIRPLRLAQSLPQKEVGFSSDKQPISRKKKIIKPH